MVRFMPTRMMSASHRSGSSDMDFPLHFTHKVSVAERVDHTNVIMYGDYGDDLRLGQEVASVLASFHQSPDLTTKAVDLSLIHI